MGKLELYGSYSPSLGGGSLLKIEMWFLGTRGNNQQRAGGGLDERKVGVVHCFLTHHWMIVIILSILNSAFKCTKCFNTVISLAEHLKKKRNSSVTVLTSPFGHIIFLKAFAERQIRPILSPSMIMWFCS